MKPGGIMTLELRSQCARRARAGSTLIDVAVGTAMLSLLMIPTVGMMGRSSRLARQLAIEEALLFDADQILEQHKVLLCDPAVFSGSSIQTNSDMADSWVTNGRYALLSEHDSSIPMNRLRTITVTAWQDSNRNGQVDAIEPQQTLRTQWCQP
ncbi:MAG: hypothetical protein AAGC97_05050 [Planctomycetota bacterium]